MSETEKAAAKRKRATFGVVFLTIFLDMVGFSVIFPLFPAMLDHYLARESALGGGMLTDFVLSLQGLAFEGDSQNDAVSYCFGHFKAVFQILAVFGAVFGNWTPKKNGTSRTRKLNLRPL